MFAKLYDTDVGQILVKLDEGEDGAEVRIYFKPKGLGVCSVSLSWAEDTEDEQWANADAAFEKLTEEKCFTLVSETMATL